MTSGLGYVKIAFGVLAALFAYSTAMEIMNGNLKSGLTPGGIEFATSHPMVTAIVLVLGATIIGAPFIQAMSNY